MKTDEKLYNQIIETCLEKSEDTALETIVCFLTNLRGEHAKIDWIIDSLIKIRNN